MNNVTSINRGPSFLVKQRREPQQKASRFFVGVAFAVGIAESVWAFYWGVLAAVALGLSVATGIVLGLVIYLYFPFETISCVHKGTQSEAPDLKKAA